MKYCRYCSYCINGDVYYCTCHDKILSRIDKITSCEDYAESELGDVDTGKRYKPRKTDDNAVVQQTVFDMDGDEQ